jgi:hypothetical protein
MWRNQAMGKAWKRWTEHVMWRREKRKIVARWKNPMKASCLELSLRACHL